MMHDILTIPKQTYLSWVLKETYWWRWACSCMHAGGRLHPRSPRGLRAVHVDVSKQLKNKCRISRTNTVHCQVDPVLNCQTQAHVLLNMKQCPICEESRKISIQKTWQYSNWFAILSASYQKGSNFHIKKKIHEIPILKKQQNFAF